MAQKLVEALAQEGKQDI